MKTAVKPWRHSDYLHGLARNEDFQNGGLLLKRAILANRNQASVHSWLHEEIWSCYWRTAKAGNSVQMVKCFVGSGHRGFTSALYNDINQWFKILSVSSTDSQV